MCSFMGCDRCDATFILDLPSCCFGGVDIDGVTIPACDTCVMKLPPYTQQDYDFKEDGYMSQDEEIYNPHDPYEEAEGCKYCQMFVGSSCHCGDLTQWVYESYEQLPHAPVVDEMQHVRSMWRHTNEGFRDLEKTSPYRYFDRDMLCEETMSEFIPKA